MSRKWQRWWKGLLGGVIGGAASAGGNFVGMATAKSVGITVPDLNINALWIMMLVGGLTNAFAYLKQSPLAPDDDTTLLVKETKETLTITTKDPKPPDGTPGSP